MRPLPRLLAGLALQAIAFRPLAAQGATHLNVAPSQLVDVGFWRDTAQTNVYVMGPLTRADGTFLGYGVPAGKLLILREAQMYYALGARTYAPTLVFLFMRAYAAPGGGTYSYGARRTAVVKAAASAVATDEFLAFDMPAGMAFTDTYRPRLIVNGPSALVTSVQLSASGYLVDLPPAAAAAPRAEALVELPAAE